MVLRNLIIKQDPQSIGLSNAWHSCRGSFGLDDDLQFLASCRLLKLVHPRSAGQGNRVCARLDVGGDFQFHFNVLVGDGSGNGMVDAGDYTTWANNFGLPLDADVIKADFNANGGVDAGDYTTWANNFGANGPGNAGDINEDNKVDAADYTIWANNFGLDVSGSGSQGAVAAVPEPSTFLLTCFGLLGLTVYGWRRRR